MNGYPSVDPPAKCALCGHPFPLSGEGSHYEAWRGRDGKFFCSELCALSADGAEQFIEPRRARGK